MVELSEQQPALLKLNTGLSFGVSNEGRIKACPICGQIMGSETICPYNEPAITSFICKNENCMNYKKVNWSRGRTFKEE